jgi:hypothetical protein
MIHHYLYTILIYVIAFDFVIAGVLVVFMINSRIILRKRYVERRAEIRAMKAAQQYKTSEDASRSVGMSIEEFESFCRSRNISTPEVRIQRKEDAERRKQEDIQRIMAEEAAWRAEQERVSEQRRLEKEEEMKQRKERLKKFGIS